MGDRRHEISVIGFGQRPIVLVDYTGEIRLLEAGVARIAARHAAARTSWTASSRYRNVCETASARVANSS